MDQELKINIRSRLTAVMVHCICTCDTQLWQFTLEVTTNTPSLTQFK